MRRLRLPLLHLLLRLRPHFLLHYYFSFDFNQQPPHYLHYFNYLPDLAGVVAAARLPRQQCWRLVAARPLVGSVVMMVLVPWLAKPQWHFALLRPRLPCLPQTRSWRPSLRFCRMQSTLRLPCSWRILAPRVSLWMPALPESPVWNPVVAIADLLGILLLLDLHLAEAVHLPFLALDRGQVPAASRVLGLPEWR